MRKREGKKRMTPNFSIDAYGTSEEATEALHAHKVALVQDAFRRYRVAELPLPSRQVYIVMFEPLSTEGATVFPSVFGASEKGFKQAASRTQRLLQMQIPLDEMIVVAKEDSDPTPIVQQFQRALKEFLLVPTEYGMRSLYALSEEQHRSLWEIKLQRELEQGKTTSPTKYFL